MGRDLFISESLTIPQRELRFSFVRSSGPGGQNVNKVNTKAQLRWLPADSVVLEDALRARLLRQCRSRINEAGELLLSSDRYRSQNRNIEDCLERLRALVTVAATPPRARRVTRKPRRANEKRLREKRAQSDKKGRRRGKHGED